MVKLCTRVLQDLATNVPSKPRLQILVKLCTRVLQDLATDVPRKPRCRVWSNCVLEFCRI